MAADLKVPVLLTSRELDQGGVERDVAKLATNLDTSKFAPHVATYSNWGMRYHELRAAGIPVLHLPVKAPLTGAGLSAAVTLGRYMRKHRIQVVHSWDVSGVLAIPVARLLRVPAVISSQMSYREILDARTQQLLRITDPMADVILVNCNAIRRYMTETFGVKPDRIELCYNGVETKEFNTSKYPRPEVLADASLVVGTVCALRPEKDLMTLLEAFARASKPAGTKLLIVGSGPEHSRLVWGVNHLEIASSTVFVSATSEVARWLHAIDVFVLPSRSEAFSNSLLEAMACGCAVVGSCVGGTPELVGEHEERGLLFASGDIAALAEKLSLLLENGSLREGLSNRASQFAAGTLNIQTAVYRMETLYTKLLARRQVSG